MLRPASRPCKRRGPANPARPARQQRLWLARWCSNHEVHKHCDDHVPRKLRCNAALVRLFTPHLSSVGTVTHARYPMNVREAEYSYSENAA